jgi:hypothetical protein
MVERPGRTKGTETQTPSGSPPKAVAPTPDSNLRRTWSMHLPKPPNYRILRPGSRSVCPAGKMHTFDAVFSTAPVYSPREGSRVDRVIRYQGATTGPWPAGIRCPPHQGQPGVVEHQTGWSIERFVSTIRRFRKVKENAIRIVLSPGSFMYRVATLMCMPIHDDAETARRAATATRLPRLPRRAPPTACCGG